MGIAVVSEDALAATAVPDPASDFNQDWYYWTGRSIKVRAPEGPQVVTWDADIRSMRRLRGGYRLVMVSETGANEDSLEIHTTMRLLWTQEP